MTYSSLIILVAVIMTSSLGRAQVPDCCQAHKGVTVQAEELEGQQIENYQSFADDYIRHLPDHAVKQEEMASDVCKKTTSPTPDKMKSYISSAISRIHPDQTPEWLVITGWKVKTKAKFQRVGSAPSETTERTFIHQHCVVSLAAKTPATDLAESMMMYRFKPAELQNNCPKKYNYLRDNVFHREFTKASCG